MLTDLPCVVHVCWACLLLPPHAASASTTRRSAKGEIRTVELLTGGLVELCERPPHEGARKVDLVGRAGERRGLVQICG
jgi:hypothetical protein